MPVPDGCQNYLTKCDQYQSEFNILLFDLDNPDGTFPYKAYVPYIYVVLGKEDFREVNELDLFIRKLELARSVPGRFAME